MTILRSGLAQFATLMRSWDLTTSAAPQLIAPGAKVAWLKHRLTRIYLVQAISCLRLLVSLGFGCLAFRNVPFVLLVSIYICAIASDMLDGYLSRRLNAQTHFGEVLDLVADKSLTATSLLYAARCGMDIAPLAFIAVRDFMMMGMRLVRVEERQLLPTSKVFGGIMAALLWGNTLFLIYARETGVVAVANIVYWICGIFFGINLVARVYKSTGRIRAAAMQ